MALLREIKERNPKKNVSQLDLIDEELSKKGNQKQSKKAIKKIAESTGKKLTEKVTIKPKKK